MDLTDPDVDDFLTAVVGGAPLYIGGEDEMFVDTRDEAIVALAGATESFQSSRRGT